MAGSNPIDPMSILSPARNTPQIMVYNKIDKLEGWETQIDGSVVKKLDHAPIFTNHFHLLVLEISIESMCTGADFFPDCKN